MLRFLRRIVENNELKGYEHENTKTETRDVNLKKVPTNDLETGS